MLLVSLGSRCTVGGGGGDNMVPLVLKRLAEAV
jgi:hypothetical protein